MAFKSAELLPGRGSLLVQSMRAPLSWLQGDNLLACILLTSGGWDSEIPKGWGAGNQHPSLPQLVIAWAPSQYLPSLQQPGGLACGPSTFAALALILPPAYFLIVVSYLGILFWGSLLPSFWSEASYESSRGPCTCFARLPHQYQLRQHTWCNQLAQMS